MLQVELISKRYGTTLALDNVALTIPKGVCYGLVHQRIRQIYLN